jgi:thiaminase/transcriptional activator TenA
VNAVAVERSLHAGFGPDLGADPGAEPAPATLLYSGFLLRAARDDAFLPALAAFLPCYWIYLEVGRALLPAGSPDPLYARWIATYSGPEFASAADDVINLFNRTAAGASQECLRRARDNHRQAARLEWMFWDSAWRREQWPLSQPTQ